MDATEGMRKAIAERKRVWEEKLKLMRASFATPKLNRQERREEQHRQE